MIRCDKVWWIWYDAISGFGEFVEKFWRELVKDEHIYTYIQIPLMTSATRHTLSFFLALFGFVSMDIRNRGNFYHEVFIII